MMLEQAVNIANIQNAKKPKQAVKAGYRTIEKSEKKIADGNHGKTIKKPTVEILSQLNKAFGGGANG